MNNYIIIGQYLMNIIIYSVIITNKYKNDKHIHYELEKTKKYLQAYIKNKNIKKPKYEILNDREKQLLAEILLKIKEEDKELYNISKKIILFTNKSNIRNFEYNLLTLKINRKKKNKLIMIIKNDLTIGTYDIFTNEIDTFDKKKTTLTHEILHSSSSNPYYAAVGFNRLFGEIKEIELEQNEIGRGLNEGYTELINNRLFKEKSYSYILLNKIAYLIELLFENKEDMKNYYFNNNLEGIIYELNKYIKEEEIIELLIDIDELYYNKNIFTYFKIKKKILKIIEQNKTEEEIENFKKEYHQNHLIKIMKKSL
ncbi:MAG: hypothetical protein IKG40_00875 [Bacilli bacterium]|nr:hypothetical protein [Bacilli bacterium]